MKQKLVFKVIYVLCTIILVCPNVMYAKTKDPRNIPGTAIFVMAEPTPISFESKSFNYDEHQTKISIQVPQITIDNRKQKSLNKQLEADAKIRMQQMIKESKSINNDLKRDGLPSITFEYCENFNEIKSIIPYHTLEIFKYEYKGGAHGIGEVQYLTLNMKEQTVVELKDLFKEKVDYKALINTYIQNQIAERTLKEEVFFKGNEGFQSIKENQPFYINAQNELVIVFNIYEIAPYSSGILYFPIPIHEIQGYMK